MDADLDSAWICTQAVVGDSQSDNEQEKINDYGYVVLNDMIENGRYILKEGDNTIGRHPLNDIYIEHPSVSMNHAVIQCDSDGIVLLDKGSLNKTKLNKKTLRKDVAYFLEENALLMFGEVQADYFINESNEFINDTKPMASDNTSIHKSTQNDELSISKLSNTAITAKSFRTDISNTITNCNVSLVIENSSTSKIGKEVPKTNTESEFAMNTLNDVHTKLNSSSPSDKYLLEALNQIETNQNNVNSNEIFHNLSNKNTSIMNLEAVSKITQEDTSSPVMDLKNSILNTNNITKNLFQSPNKINTEAIREDTPSPIMDLGYYNNFENELETNNHNEISTIQSPNKVYELNNTQVLEIDNNVELYTQTLKPSSSLINHLKTNKFDMPDECTQLPITDDKNTLKEISLSKVNINKKIYNKQNKIIPYESSNCQTKKNVPSILSNTILLNPSNETEIQIIDDIYKVPSQDQLTSKSTSLCGGTQIEDNKSTDELDFFNCPTQKISSFKSVNSSISKNQSSQKQNETNFKSFDKNDNDILFWKAQKIEFDKKSNIPIKNLFNIHNNDDSMSSNNINLNSKCAIKPTDHFCRKNKILNDFNNDSAQIGSAFSHLKKTTDDHNNKHQRNVNTFDADDDDIFRNFIEKECKSQQLDFVVHENQDFFSCSTQKVLSKKKIHPKTTSLIHKETQKLIDQSEPNKKNASPSKSYSTSTHKDLTQIPGMDDDFFNCLTQKISITKKIDSKPKVCSSIHAEETEMHPEFIQFDKTNNTTSKSDSTIKHEYFSDALKIDDDDFFNCPTQKLSITKKLNPKQKVSSLIHEEETQRLPEFSQFNRTNNTTSKSGSTIKQEDCSDALRLDDDDFFNCPTQKVSITKKINPKPKVSPLIHEEETQKHPEFSQVHRTNNTTSKSGTTIKQKDCSDALGLDDDDFFNCPTQKVSITKKIDSKPKVCSLIHEEETQKPPEFSQFNRTNNITSKSGSTIKQEDCSDTLKINDEEFFNCPQNISDGSNNHKQTFKPNNGGRCNVQKSKYVNSNSISLSNVPLPIILNENSSNSLKINKTTIRIKEDLHMSYSGDLSNNSMIILNKPIENTLFNNINTTLHFNKNFDLPGCSKTTTDTENNLNALSFTKQEHVTDDAIQFQVPSSLKNSYQITQINESIFSPLNIPDASANSLLEHHSSPKTVENNLNTLNCEPSTSSNNASEWKSFWNKKKVQSLDKEKSNKQKSIKITNEVQKNKERYQTRALTKKENALKLNRKRKQDGVEESNKKICNRIKILDPLAENTSEIVVSFSYLKSRHLQEMKQFVDKTGGTVTDEITQCSVLVTDKIRCTMKILSAIARGCPIVNVNWLKHSYTVKMFQDVDDFIIVDKDAERKYKFRLKESLAKAKTKKLLDGYNVLVTPSVKPSPQEMKVIITCAGGNYVLNWTTTQYTKELIVTCDKDRIRWKPAWDNDMAKIIDSDALVMSIIRQKLTI